MSGKTLVLEGVETELIRTGALPPSSTPAPAVDQVQDLLKDLLVSAKGDYCSAVG